MTTIESGTAVGVNYIEDETRAVAIHEAGHAVCSHVYMEDVLSTRLSIRMRGGSLGHHQVKKTEEQTRERIMKRFETIGTQLMNRTRGSADFHADPIASVLRDPHKNALAAQTLGQAYVTAANFVVANREAVQRIADAVVAKRELFGDELVELLESARLRRPEIDYLDEASWPRQ